MPPVPAPLDAVQDRPPAVLVQRARPALVPAEALVDRLLVVRHRRPLEERGRLVEHARVAGRVDVAGGQERQPHVVVAEVRPHADGVSGRVPPVQHVALLELPRRRPQQVLARRLGPAPQQGGGVLELVAEAVRAAALVVPGAAPVAAGERLIFQPAVRQHVDGRVRRVDVERAQRAAPELPHGLERPPGLSRAGVAGAEPAGVGLVVARAQREDDCPLLAGAEVDRGHDRGAGVEAAADAAAEVGAAHRRGVGGAAVSADKLGAVARDRPLALAAQAARQERHAVAEVGVVRVAGEDGPRLGVDAGRDVRRALVPLIGQHPLAERRRRHAPPAVGLVCGASGSSA